jgi:hypothetical protein
LIAVRYFGQPDYECGEVTASGKRSERREALCGLPETMPVALDSA